MPEIKFSVQGMSCAACSARVQSAVAKVNGVTECNVSLLTSTLAVEGNASDNDLTVVCNVINFASCTLKIR